MKQESKETPLERRVRMGHVQKRDIQRRLAELAFGRANDCVKLVLEESPEVDALDLSLLSEVKRSDRGAVEVKLIDRLRALEALSGVVGSEEGEMKAFLQALRGGAFRKNPGHGAELFPMGYVLLRWAEVWHLRENHCLAAAQCSVGNSAETYHIGGGVQGKTDGKLGHRVHVGP